MRWARALGVLAAVVALSTAAVASSQPSRHGHLDITASGYAIPKGIHKIRHIVIIMQENRSFDNYFGTYPGAAGIPLRNGQPAVCIPAPAKHSCVKFVEVQLCVQVSHIAQFSSAWQAWKLEAHDEPET